MGDPPRCTLMRLSSLEERRIDDATWPEITLAATSLVIIAFHLFAILFLPSGSYL